MLPWTRVRPHHPSLSRSTHRGVHVGRATVQAMPGVGILTDRRANGVCVSPFRGIGEGALRVAGERSCPLAEAGCRRVDAQDAPRAEGE